MKRREFVHLLSAVAVVPRLRPPAVIDVVEKFGVRNDGTEPAGASNAARITSALADAARLGGGTLLFPSGVYAIGAGLAVPSDRITIAGEGRSTVFDARFAAGSRDFVWTAVARHDLTFRDFVLRGAHSGGVRIHGSSGCRVVAVDISGATRVNTQGFCAGIYVSDVDDLTIDRCALSGNGRGRAAGAENDADICANMGSEQIRNSRITNNRCLSTTAHQNVAIFDPVDLVVSGNTVSGAIVSQRGAEKQGYGIMLYHTATLPRARRGACRVSDNVVNDTEGSGIFIQGIPDTIVAGNAVARAGGAQTDGALAVAGIVVEGVRDPENLYGAGKGALVGRQTVSGNRVSDCPRAGISLSSTASTICIGNIIDRCRYGISLRGESADLTVVDNIVTNVRASGEGMGIGQWSETVISRVRISGNTIRGVPASSVGIWARPTSNGWVIADNDVSEVRNGTAYVIRGIGHGVSSNRADGRPVSPPG